MTQLTTLSLLYS